MMFVIFCPRKKAIGRIESIAKKPTIDAISQFLGHIEKKTDFCSNDKKVTIALINMVTEIAVNNVIRSKENNERDINIS
jgi:hypothetical protein|tara:strand:- start:796 stop:1032 length:237 start_codon:yes stop_codon:yes gene_type:complete